MEKEEFQIYTHLRVEVFVAKLTDSKNLSSILFEKIIFIGPLSIGKGVLNVFVVIMDYLTNLLHG